VGDRWLNKMQSRDPNGIIKKWDDENKHLVELNRKLLEDHGDKFAIKDLKHLSVRHDIQDEYDTYLDTHYHNFIIMMYQEKMTGREKWDIKTDKVVGNDESDVDKIYTKYTDEDKHVWDGMLNYRDKKKRTETTTINPQLIENNEILNFIKNC
jgi:hypothetical protein